MNDIRCFKIVKRFLQHETLTHIARHEHLSFVRIFQIVKRQAEYLLPDVENISFFTPRRIREVKGEILLKRINRRINKENRKKRLSETPLQDTISAATDTNYQENKGENEREILMKG